MIDEQLLADPTRCPSCSAPLREPRTACPACQVVLTGPVAGRLWQVSVEASRLLAERERLVARLRGERGAPAAYIPSAPAPGDSPRHAPRPEWTPRRVQNLLLALGIGLLGVAAVIFVVVSWGNLGVGGRAAVMTGLTALAGYAGLHAHRRGLESTAEALSLLTVGLTLLDCAGARASDLGGLRDVDGLVFAAATTALVAAGAAVFSRLLPTRSLRLSAALLAQLPVPLLAVHAADRTDQPLALLAAFLAAQSIADLAVALAWPGTRRTRDARVAVLAAAGGSGLLATALATGAAYGEDGSLVVGCAVLLVVAVAVAAAAEFATTRLAPSGPAGAVPGVLRGAAAVLVAVAAWAPVVELAQPRWVPALLSAVVLALLALTAVVPADRRTSPAVALLALAGLPGVDALPVLGTAVAGRLQWVEQAWTVSADGSAVELLASPQLGDLDRLLVGPAAVLLLTVAAALGIAARLVPALRPALAAAVPVAAGAGVLAATALDATYALALAADIALALVGLAGGTLLVRSGWRDVGVAALLSGATVLTLGVAWSLAVDVATLVVLPAVAAVLLVVVAAGRGTRELRAARVAAGVAAGLLLVGEGAALARYGGAGWPAVHSVGLTLLALGAGAAAVAVTARTDGRDPFWTTLATALGVTAVAATLGAVGAVARWQGADAAGVGLAVSVAAAVALAASTLPVPPRPVPADAVRAVAGTAAVAGLLAAATDGDQLWLALLAVGVGVAVLGIRLDRRWGWLSGLLLTASSWVRLALSDVTAPEAYTVPPALALLAVGALRRRRDPAYPSWPAYGAGLALAFGPSLLRAVTDAGNLRPLLLGLAALVVLGLGVARRLQAPLVVGGAVLAVDAGVQLAPYLAAVYDVVPRWLTIGLVGLLLLVAGATYEQRVRDLRRVGKHVARLG
jgi:hypothetical protein